MSAQPPVVSDPSPVLDRFRRTVLADRALQARLLTPQDDRAFTAMACAEAQALGMAVAAGDIAAVLDPSTPDPRRGFPHMLALDAAPPAMWLPVGVVLHGDAIGLEWLPVPPDALHHPFFEQSIAALISLPFARLMRCVTPLAALDAFVSEPVPDGLVLHMSRCGSTLVAQMLAAVPGFVSIAEPPVLDCMLQLACEGVVGDMAVRNLAAALTRDRGAGADRRFIKLDCWHALALPRLRRIFPTTPWVFLYRDAMEVLVSQRRKPGIHVHRGGVPLAAFGAPGDDRVADADYPAWIIAQYCTAALASARDPLGRLVAYPELPAAVEQAILPHFGIAPDPARQAYMLAAAQRDSKRPESSFNPDSADKQAEAARHPRTSAEQQLTALVEALDRARNERERKAQAAPGVRLHYDF